MDQAAIAESSTEELASAVAQIHALECAVRSSLLELLRTCDERKVWVEDGCRSLESWLAMRLHITWRSAADLVRVARGLADLPAISDAFASGVLSWDKVRALAVVASPADDARLADEATLVSASQLEGAARRRRERSEAEHAAAGAGRGLGFRCHRSLPITRIGGWIPNDQIDAIRRAIEREADRIPPNPETGELDSYAARRADALYKICSQRLAADADADRATVILYEQPDGSVTLADGTGLPDSAAERMRCDCREQHADGSVDQVISPALRRKILRRDGGCTFPGCEERRWLHIHHVIHRSRGGPTTPENLRARCGFCHLVVHRPGWREEFGPDGEVHIFRPDGTEFTTDPPPPLSPDLRARLNGWLPFTGAEPPPTDGDDTP
jgi:hypothetical protein